MRIARGDPLLAMHAMPNDPDTSSSPPGPGQIRQWAEELDATPEQIEQAIAAVGPRQADIEMHLKGSRSTSNSDRTREAGG
jgi:hypothetical protein